MNKNVSRKDGKDISAKSSAAIVSSLDVGVVWKAVRGVRAGVGVVLEGVRAGCGRGLEGGERGASWVWAWFGRRLEGCELGWAWF